MYQKVSLIGNLGRKPELKFSQNGKPFTSFSLATNKKFINGQGDEVEQVCWWRITTWGRQAEVVAEYANKGDRVFVEGEMSPDASGNPRVFQTKDGAWASGYEMTAQVVKLLDGKKQGDDDDDQF